MTRWVTGTTAVIILALLGACGTPRGQPATATVSSDDVIRTAEAIAESTRRAASPTPSPSPTALSPTPTLATATPSPTSTPGIPTVRARENARVRRGPGEQYELIDFLFADQTAEVLGRNENPTTGTWWFVRRIGQGLDGWVWNGVVEFSGDLARVPFLPAPPTSTPSPGPTDTASPVPTATITP